MNTAPEPEGVAVTIIGAGSPHPSASRLGSAVAIRSRGKGVLVDAGPGTVYKMLQYGLQPLDFDAFLITHHHFDHTAGAPAFMLMRWESSLGSETPLFVAGPRGTTTFINALVGPEGAYRPDIVARREAPLTHAKIRWLGGTLPRPDLETEIHEVGPGVSFDLPFGWRVRTALANHVEPYHESIGFRVEVDGIAVCVTGDSERNADLTGLARDADLLVAMCGDREANMEKAGLAQGQMGTISAATLARDAHAKAMVMTHTGTRMPRSPNRERALHEVGEIFKGDVYFSEEGLTIDLPARDSGGI